MVVDAQDFVPTSDVQRNHRHAFLLAYRLGPWAPVRAGVSREPLEIVHCAHCDRYSGEHLWHHRSCLAVRLEEE